MVTKEKNCVRLTCKRFPSLLRNKLNRTSFHLSVLLLASRKKRPKKKKKKTTVSYSFTSNWHEKQNGLLKIVRKYNENEFIST